MNVEQLIGLPTSNEELSLFGLGLGLGLGLHVMLNEVPFFSQE